MSSYTLTVPEKLYRRAEELARLTARQVDEVLIDQLQELMLPPLPGDEQAELDAMRALSDDALWAIARERMGDDLQDQLQHLMARNDRGLLSPVERGELEKLVERGNRLMLRKAEAAALLRERGHAVTPHDLAGGDD
ncbi:MAG: hypothetical protein MUF38_15985 [Anaerolineae bacterium]|jgi:hypothetical protein|nr:hypothetical protein [Anaerolineae bacterium]